MAATPGAGGASDDPAVAAAFLNRWLEDVEAGRPGELADYLALYPGHAELVEREWRALVAARAAPAREEDDGGGERVAHYRVERELGRGGQGVVFLATDLRLRRPVALKVLAGLGPGSERHLARFRREAEVASRLAHAGICAVHDSGVDGGRAYIAMRFVEGETLAARVARARELGAARVTLDSGDEDGDPVHGARLLELFERAALALHAAHEAGVVHRDVKPGNVMVTPEGEPVLLDFGLARDDSDDAASGLTATGDVFGTPAYMSPEQVAGRPSDRRTDVWSLAATLYECLTLERPFGAPTRDALYQAILETDPADVRSLDPSLPRDLAVVLATALEKDPDRRYRTAEELALELGRVRRNEPVRARAVGPLERAWRSCQRNPALAAAGAVSFALLALALAVTSLWLRTSEESRAILLDVNEQLEAALDDARAGRLSKREKRVAELVERGFQRFFAGRWEGADRLFEEALAEDAANRQALAGLFWYRTYAAPDALAAIDEWAERHGGGPLVHWMRARILEDRGDGEGAARELALAGDAQDDVRAYLEGLRAIRSFDPSAGPDEARAALPWFRRAIARARRPWFHHWHALMMAADRAGDRETVDAAAEALEWHWPDSSSTWDAIAQFYFAADPERSLAAMHRSVELVDSAMAHIGIAQHALRNGDSEAARASLDRALAADPGLAAAHYMKAAFLVQAGELGAARERLLAAIDVAPGEAYAYGQLRDVCERAGGPELALSTLEELAERHPDSPWARLEVGRLLLAAGEPAAAAETLLAALACLPWSPEIAAELRRALAVADDPRAALSDDELRALASGE